MMLTTKKWMIQTTPDRTILDQLSSSLKVHPTIASLLMQRGITSYEAAEAFFNPKLSDCHDPFLMKNMLQASTLLQNTLLQQKKILLYGDYDVDGTTAVALMYSFLAKEGAHVDFYIPDRYSEGYGLSFQGIDYAIAQQIDLLITLDCGIKSVDKIAKAKAHGIEVIVCDHHEPGAQLPDAWVLDPKQNDCTYPFKELTGCGVGYKLLSAFLHLTHRSQEELYPYLDLMALSIGADIVQVTGENRIFTYHGLQLFNTQTRPVFKMLLDLAKKTLPITLTDVVFTIAPRINAAGRLRSGKYAVEMMISHHPEEQQKLADAIHADNTDRRDIDQAMTKEALTMLENDPNFFHKKATVVYHENWHKGVVGIVASRLIERHFKPTIVLTYSNGKVTGSARTVNDFNLYQALAQCDDLLEQWGGHQHAAGLTLSLENLKPFMERFEAVVAASISEEDQYPIQKVDLKIRLSDLYGAQENRLQIPRFKRIIDRFEPFGPGNMKPTFLVEKVFSKELRILKDAHLKLSFLQADQDVILEGIGFNLAEKADLVAHGLPYDIVFTLENNAYNNRITLQANVKDIREHENLT